MASERQQFATSVAECAIATRLAVQTRLDNTRSQEKEEKALEDDDLESGFYEDYYSEDNIVNVTYEENVAGPLLILYPFPYSV